MKDYKTIIGVVNMRTDGHPILTTATRFGIGNGTVDLIMKRFNESNLTVNELLSMDPNDVERLIYPPENTKKNGVKMPNFETIHTNVNRQKNPSTLFIEWMEYKKSNPSGYQYTQFCHYYKKFVKQNFGDSNLSMAINRKPGEKLFIDWVGDTPELVYDQQTGEMLKAHFFVTTVGVSNCFYVKAFPNEKLNSFIDGTVSEINYYGAVPTYLVPDNLKAAITKHTKDSLIVNSAYEDLETFYDTVVLPPPARKPKGKATAERYVQFVETRLIPILSQNMFPSFEALNRKISVLIDEFNSEHKNAGTPSKKETFEKYDKPEMKPLPMIAYSEVEYKYVSKVSNNYHVEYDNHYYSIPYQYYEASVIVKATGTDIKICDVNNRLIYRHSRSYKNFPKYITVDSHMPPNHSYWKEINEGTYENFMRRADSIGPNMRKLIHAVKCTFKHEEQSYNSLNGILHSCDGISRTLCDEAARKCIDAGGISYSYFKKVLNSSIDKVRNTDGTLPKHANVRGKDFYK